MQLAELALHYSPGISENNILQNVGDSLNDETYPGNHENCLEGLPTKLKFFASLTVTVS